MYRTLPPPAPLAPFVECLWIHDVPEAADGDGRILPDGRIDLVWIRGLGAVVAGPQSSYTTRPVGAPMLAVGARFHPGAAPLLLRTPAYELLDDHVPLAAVDARLATRLESADGSLDALSRELLRRLDGLRPDPAVREAVALLASLPVSEVAERVFVSERQLGRRFRETVGYGPKTLQRILRLQRAIGQLPAGLARAAAAAGYADQAHLSRESRSLTGLTPSELARWLRGYA